MTSIRVLLFMAGLVSADRACDEQKILSKRDISVAFLQSREFEADEPDRWVSYRPWAGADERIFKLRGPLYGQRSASRRWFETVSS